MEVNYRNPKIYLLSGKARHGKDTIAGYLKRILRKRWQKGYLFTSGQIYKVLCHGDDWLGWQ